MPARWQGTHVKDTPAITRLLAAARRGERRALDDVFALVYEQIGEIARRQLRRVGRPETLDTTAVVHEAYIKLIGAHDAPWEDRSHFFNVAAAAMRQILVDHARRRLRGKRGGGALVLPLDEARIAVDDRAHEILELDSALERLALVDERLCRVVELRFFGGLSVEETAKALGVTDRTVKRDWQTARALLYRDLGGGASEPSA
jgi:RNA polymerase sigma factor (TIGR02999 family)